MENHLTLEQLSSLLDEEPPDDARSHVDTCGVCRSAADRMAEARTFLAEDVALPPHLLDDAIAAAVTALDRTNVEALVTRRRIKPLPWLAAVAAVLVGLLGIGALVNGAADRDRDTVATGAGEDETTAAVEDGAAPQPEAGSGSFGAASGSGGAEGGGQSTARDSLSRAAAPPPERSFNSEQEVIAYLRESADAMATTATSCSTEATATLGVSIERLRSEDVNWQDAVANLWVDPGQRRAVVMRPGGCSLAADVRY